MKKVRRNSVLFVFCACGLALSVSTLNAQEFTPSDEIEILRKQLKTGNRKQRLDAIASLGKMGARAKSAIPDLLSLGPVSDLCCEPPHDPYYCPSIEALVAIGDESLAPTFRVLKDGGVEQRRFAYFVIKSFADKDSSLREKLYWEMLSNTAVPIRQLAMSDISRMTSPSERYFPRLVELLKDEADSFENRRYAAGTLSVYETEAARSLFPYFMSLYRNRQAPWQFRETVVFSMSALGRRRSDTLKLLHAIAQDKDELVVVRVAAIVGLRTSKLGELPMPELETLLKDAIESKEETRSGLADDVLGEILKGNPRPEVLPLLKMVMEAEMGPRPADYIVLKVLKRLGCEADEFGPYLVDRLRALPPLPNRELFQYVDTIKRIQSQLGIQFSLDQILGSLDLDNDARKRITRLRSQVIK